MTNLPRGRGNRVALVLFTALLGVLPVVAADATGGAIVRSGNYLIHTFTTNGTFTLPSARYCDYLIIGGGGGGKEGGGGGGGFAYYTSQFIQAGNHTITVGSGGSAGTGSSVATNGGNSSFGSTIAYGGGRAGENGASGGGAPRDHNGPGGEGSNPQGHDGGGADAGGWCSSGGGGGAGGAGGNGRNVGGSHDEWDEWSESYYEVWDGPDDKGGDGGPGRRSDITGVELYYAGGGGGTNESGYGTVPLGGVGGGGAGSQAQAVGGSGTNGLGGGGGAHAPGGSGVVIVRYYSLATPQTIAFASIPNKTHGDAPFTISANATSGLPVTLTVTSGPATLSGNTVTLTGLGTVTITASQPGNLDYGAAPNVSQTFTVKYSQTVTFGSLGNKIYGDVPFTVSATTSSGLPAVFSVSSGPAVVTNNTVTLTAAGTVTITASQPGNATYNPAPGVSQTFTVAKGPIVEGTGGTITRSGDYLVHTFTSNGTFSVPGQVTSEMLLVGGGGGGGEGGGGGGGVFNFFGKIIAAGSYIVTIGGGGAGSSSQLGVNGGNTSFDGLTVHGGGGGGLAGASGGGAVRDANGPGGAASYGTAEGYPGGRSNESGWSAAGGGGGAGGPGQDGNNEGGWDDEYQEWLEPDGKGGDGGIGRLSSVTGSNVYYGGGGGGTNQSGAGATPIGGQGGGGSGSKAQAIGGAGTNGLGGGGGAHASGGSGVVIIRYYSPIPIPQTISFGALANRTYGDAPVSIAATASSGLPVTFGVAGPATITGNIITLGSPGTVTVVASQVGGSGYAAAPNVNQSFTIAKASQTVTFGALAGRTFGEAPFAVSASTSSGLPVAFAITSGPAVVLGGTLTLTGMGTVVVTATQAGNENYLSANQTQSFTVSADTSAPSVPSGLSASETMATSVRLTWNAASDNIGVTRYEITAAGVPTRTIAGTTVRISGLQPQTSYTFNVQARDAAGNASLAATVNITTTQASATSSDSDGVPDAVEELLGTDKNVNGVSDSTDQLGLKTHKPQQ